MTTTVSSALDQYERLVEKGDIRSFTILIEDEGLLIQPKGAKTGKEGTTIQVIQELHTSLRAFFYGVTAIEHNSFDYATLKSFINASMCQDRLAS